ncbi:MAG: PA0069 family radical SAM protein [Pikeienuella sp.]|uniref:PA0069 family radical SAM protein n=1 Tax=Pikeienuella sp. TaxID=2831957 RepID=UPI003919087A
MAKGRGAVSNRSGRFDLSRMAEDDGWAQEEEGEPPRLRTELTIDRSKSVISRVVSPDLNFERSLNPYRGCEHGCVYCFARPTHAWLGLSPGLDFETKITVKPDAPALLRRALSRPGYRPKTLAIGTNTDPYQPVEKTQRIMRGVLEVLSEFSHPVAIVTKSALVARDADILGPMGRRGLARVSLSLTTLDPALSARMEPRAAQPARRLWAMRRLAAAGCPVGVMTAPLIPAINDHEIESLLKAAAASGAKSAGYVVLRLPLEVRDLFVEWLEAAFPDRAARVMRQVRDLHGGRDYDPEWGKRLAGQGPLADLIRRRFARAAREAGLDRPAPPLREDLFAPPPAPPAPQLSFLDRLGEAPG